MSLHKRILITPGEPAGIGPDIVIQLAQEAQGAALLVIADPVLLQERAKKLGLPLQLITHDEKSLAADFPTHSKPGVLHILPVLLNTSVEPGKLNQQNADYVIRTLMTAAKLCENQIAQAIVTGPVHKGILNDAGIVFTGHTEFFADYCHIAQTVMLFVVDELKVALATTHLPLAKVPAAITKKHLQTVLSILQTGLKQQFHLPNPRILVCGLNPHAGENGYLGREEIEVITPVISELALKGDAIQGPLAADTIFTPKFLRETDAVLAMYHDQALPLVKYIGFGHAVNVTLGLPFVRTSVDHGTALDMAGTGKADPGSMVAALDLAIQLTR